MAYTYKYPKEPLTNFCAQHDISVEPPRVCPKPWDIFPRPWDFSVEPPQKSVETFHGDEISNEEKKLLRNLDV